MLLKRFYDTKLAQASYLIGCQRTGEALVVDPNRDVVQYVQAAAAEGVRITHVTETHIHADFVSGARELAARVGATLLLSGEGGDDWQYGFAAAADATLLRDGDRVTVGNVIVEVLHTPGHTPEHLSFLVTDGATSARPMGICSGDFVFVGDVGRPDLLERAAKVEGTMEASARTLFRSLERFRALPDYLQLWPGHGAGSACGKALGAVPTSTVGYERFANWAVGTTDETEFVRIVLDGQPEPPAYFAQMKRINREGPAVLGGMPRAEQRPPSALADALAARATVIDTRPIDAFVAGHVPGTLNVPLNKSFTTWAGALAAYDRELLLLVESASAADEAVRDLVMIGLDGARAFVTVDALDVWSADQGPLAIGDRQDVAAVAPRIAAGTVTVLDVRNRSEWEAGHLAGALHVPLAELQARIDEVPRDRPLVVHCQGGSRSAIAASVLRGQGIVDVTDMAGGYGGWAKSGQKTVRDSA